MHENPAEWLRGLGCPAGEDADERPALELDHALQRWRAGWPHGDEREPVVRDVRGEPVDELRIADVSLDALRGRQPLLVLGVAVDGAPRSALVPPLYTPHEIGHLVADQCDLLDRIRLGDLGERRREEEQLRDACRAVGRRQLEQAPRRAAVVHAAGEAVATLNYDLTLETACRQLNVRCDTGIETWLKGGELTWSETGVRLLKLHGSIDWVLDDTPTEADQLPFQRIRKLDEEATVGVDARPAVVFGEAGKIRSEGPYLELLLAFANELKTADALVVVGYSFRDQHVNEVVARWLSANSRRRIVVVEPGDLTGPFESFTNYVARLQQRRDGDELRPGRVLHVKDGAHGGLRPAIQAASSEAEFPIPTSPT
jgi:SIR2-like domain